MYSVTEHKNGQVLLAAANVNSRLNLNVKFWFALTANNFVFIDLIKQNLRAVIRIQ